MKETVLERARTRLMVVAPFFGSLLLRHPMRETDKVPTAAVNMRGEIMYNREFSEKLSMPEAVFVLAHEVMHNAFAHLARRGDRDPEVWNIANDAIINEILADEMHGDAKPINGCVMIKGASEYSSEQLYEKLWHEQEENGKQYGLNMDDLCHDDAEGSQPTPDEVKQMIADAKAELAAAATAAKMCGSLSANMEKIIGGFLDSKVPWYTVLERFFTGRAQQHQSWSHPNRRYLRKAYLPRRERMPSMGPIIVGVDTSGSIDDEELKKYFGHLNALFEQCHPTSVTVVYCDSAVHKVEEFTPDEFPIVSRPVVGGGGTDMGEIVRWANENAEPDCIVIFTDGYTPLPEPDECQYPLVWVCSTEALENESNVPGMVITDYKED